MKTRFRNSKETSFLSQVSLLCTLETPRNSEEALYTRTAWPSRLFCFASSRAAAISMGKIFTMAPLSHWFFCIVLKWSFGRCSSALSTGSNGTTPASSFSSICSKVRLRSTRNAPLLSRLSAANVPPTLVLVSADTWSNSPHSRAMDRMYVPLPQRTLICACRNSNRIS